MSDCVVSFPSRPRAVGVLLVGLVVGAPAMAHDAHHDGYHEHIALDGHGAPILQDATAPLPGADPFRQLTEVLPDPNEVRLASGAPGPDYWQNEADHVIDVTLDPETHSLSGSERITYTNRSPHQLTYLWLQLDQNRFREDSLSERSLTAPDLNAPLDLKWLVREHSQRGFDGGMTIHAVKDASGRDLPHAVVDTMMRVDLPRPLRPGGSVKLAIDWSHTIVPEGIRSRSRVEVLDDDLPLYEVAQWFPRMAAYTDTHGWQNKAYLGIGEFTLEFGDYTMNITVPDNYIVAGTGELVNPSSVLTRTQQQRLAEARTADKPVMVVTAEDAAANEAREPEGTRTWTFRAQDVRDVAWAASPSFLWDAWGVPIPGTNRTTMAMSFFPEEGEPLWSRYSTQSVAHALEVYSEFSTPYPWPVAISVNGPIGGMEYPMICFNGPRPEEDGTYTERTKYGLISVIIHEVGHNWFPMLINSDERMWTWMDEGLNTYVQFIAEQAWETDYPSRRGEPRKIAEFMAGPDQVPIMTNSESLLQRGNNAYAKPATALHVLRETVIGRDNFDVAFRTYSDRWRFKRPQPQDLFRTLEDVSGVDLDWFWRGWFYTTGHVDIAVTDVRAYSLRGDPEQAKAFERYLRDELLADTMSQQRNAGQPLRVDRFPELLDFYNDYDELDVTDADREAWGAYKRSLDDDQLAAVEGFADATFYAIRFENRGGLVMPIPLRLVFADGTEESVVLPAEIWRRNAQTVSRVVVSDRELAYVEIDTHGQIADSNRENNRWPQMIQRGLVDLGPPSEDRENAMFDALQAEARAEFQPTIDDAAAALLAAWQQASGAHAGDEVLTPSMAAAALEGALEGIVDPWGGALRVALAGSTDAFQDLAAGITTAEKVRLATVRSAGKDGQLETADDIVTTVMVDGSAH